jgi:hypothetical protein
MASHPTLWPFPWWTTPDTPDLGAFRQHKHGFEDDGGDFLWCEFAPWEWVNGQPHWIPHQTYVRIKNGEAAFHQRVSAWMVPEGAPPPLFQGLPPAFVLGGDHPPWPSDWVKFPVQTTPHDYWLFGENRNPAQPNWQRDTAVGHSFDLFANGTLSTVGWDDSAGDRDFNDLVVEVAVVYRRNYWSVFDEIRLEAEAIRAFEKSALPKLRASDKIRPDRRKPG